MKFLYSLLFIGSLLFSAVPPTLVYTKYDDDRTVSLANASYDCNTYLDTLYDYNPVYVSTDAECISELHLSGDFSNNWDVPNTIDGRSSKVSTTNELCTPYTDTHTTLSYHYAKEYTCNFYCPLDPNGGPTVDGVKWVLDSDNCEYIEPCVEPADETLLIFLTQVPYIECQDEYLRLSNLGYTELICHSCDLEKYDLYGHGAFPPPCNPMDCSSDCDNDGILNCIDDDDDNDGISDSNDPDHPSHNSADDTCKGQDLSKTPTITGSAFEISSYRYNGSSDPEDCVYYGTASPDYWDGSLYYPDLNPLCGYVWCRVHEVGNTCTYSASDRQPDGWVYNSSAKTENECSALTADDKYTSHVWDVPNSLACPDTAYCFLQPFEDGLNEDNTNSENNDTSMTNPDLNSTSSDLAPLLQAQNTTNTHLQDIKDKTDLTNTKLDSLSAINNNILASNKDINNNLNNLNSKANSMISSNNLMNQTLSSMNRAINTSNSYTKAVHSDLLSTNNKLNSVNAELDNITNNTNKINESIQDGLFSDIDPFSDTEYLDGSETFGELQTEVSDSFGITNESNIFGLASISGGGLQSYTANLNGTTITFFEPSMLNGLPINEMRSLILFLFAIMGFAHTFRSV